MQAVNSPQVSVLRKENIEQLGALMIGLLMELTTLAPCAWNGKTVADVAKNLIDTFWGLRIDEFIYVFRKGINGGYPDHNGETKIFGSIHAGELSRWLNEYSGFERSEAEAFLRNGKVSEFKEMQTAIENLVPKEKFSELAQKFNMQSRIEENKSAPEITRESIDRGNLKMIQELWLRKSLSDSDLQNFKKDAEQFGWNETLKFCNDEIEQRKSTQKTPKENPQEEKHC